MRTIELTANVTEDGKLVINLPADISPGEHRAVLVIDEQVIQPNDSPAEVNLVSKDGQLKPLLDVQMIEWDSLPEDTSFSREQLYDDAKY
ncbi:MAG: hypothetical protein J0I20_03655 [Chloroflexi bacterium]|nr:hypothetical protein [Chloroflexota bacterium]OJV89162.1 MAG: hypothetical protein BGO39_34695 [Chloroflexi bacterium 54-19]